MERHARIDVTGPAQVPDQSPILISISTISALAASDIRDALATSHAGGVQQAASHVADVIELTDALDLKNAIHVGHSTGGGEVARYVARARPGRVAKAVLVSAVAPIMVKTDSNPDGVPMDVFDMVREQTATNRSQFYYDFTLPFFGYNRDGAEIKEAVRLNWWRQGMMGGTAPTSTALATRPGLARAT